MMAKLSTTTAQVQRQCACASGGGTCACRKDRKPTLSRRANGSGPTEAPPIVHDVLSSPGRALDPATRTNMEARFGHDFSRVRIHTDVRASESARAVNALAYTVGDRVVFREGQYAPGTNDGSRLLAHELTHVVQQRGAPSGGLPARLEVGAADAPEEREAEAAARGAPATASGARPMLRRTPGEDARDSWDALVTHQVDPDEEARQAPTEEAISRFLGIPEGAQLMNQLWALLCGGDTCRSRILVRFADHLPPGNENATGHFSPASRGARLYIIHVRYTESLPGLGWRQWPTSGPPLVISRAREGPSQMGEALFHEMLHVWFVNARSNPLVPTGHGDAAAGEYDREFVDRLQVAAREMVDLEEEIRQEEERQRRLAEERAREEAAREAASRPAAPRERDDRRQGPPALGGSAGLHAGGIWFPDRDSAFQTVVGADVILNFLAGLRLGARGIYMTPDHLFLGPSVGYRFLEEDSRRRVERPVFFDLEAGVLFELGPATASRVSDAVSGFAGAGVGQEYGRDGPRFWWRVGGMVIVTDQPGPGEESVQTGGGATFGAGVSF